ncbi:MAG: hypothetical protein HY859_09575 [Caulobacterales bacterium]|nr:hypothetical protein [Caulobacterales bacterium]
MSTIKVKPWAEGQGEFVLIDALAFDPAVHERIEGDDTPLPGPFDHTGRVELIELAVVAFREDLAGISDEELRYGLGQRHKAIQEKARAEAALAAEAAAKAAEHNPLDLDGDKEPGGSLPDGYSLGADGTTVVHDESGQTWPGAEEFRAWRTERAELLAELSLLDVEFEGHPDNAALAALLEAARAKESEPDFLLGSSDLPAIVEVGALRVQLGGLVVASQRESGLSVADWNAEDEPTREGRLQATLNRLAADPGAAAAEIDAASIVPAVESSDADETNPTVVDIPADWKDAHWTQRVKLAKAIQPDAGDINTEAADKIVAAEVERRAAQAGA